MDYEKKKEVSYSVGYLAGFVFFCVAKGFWYAIGAMLAMMLMGVEL